MIFPFLKLPDFRKTRWMHVLVFYSAWLNIQANNIQVSNLVLTGQNVSAGVNNASNFTQVKFDVRWENSWRHNSSNGGLSYIGVKTGGAGYTGAPIVYIGSEGSVSWQPITFVTEGQLLFVSGTPNLYYRVTATHTTLSTAPTHNTGTLDNLEFVTINEGGGTGATAMATIVGGVVTGFTITNAGTGYTTLPTVSVFSTNGGSGASADAHIKSWWDAAWFFVKFQVGATNPVLTGASSSGTTVTVASTANLRAGMPVVVSAGTGAFVANTVISSISSATTFELSTPPSAALNNATIICQRIWEHANLNVSSGNHTAPAGSTIDVPSDGTGVFIYRSSAGSGTFSLSGVKLRWDYGTNGILDDAEVKVEVFAIEMVYVPQGEFAVGIQSASSRFITTTINTSTANTAPAGQGNLGGAAGGFPTSQTAPNASWPNGFNAFYCMKYELSQVGYKDFLNCLTYQQQEARTESPPDTVSGAGAMKANNFYRNGIDIQSPGNPLTYSPAVYGCNINGNGIFNEVDDGEWIACNYVNWMDACAYLDWSGLRPMSELEFEKACRGIQFPVNDELAWGTPTAVNATTINSPGTAQEGPNAGENCTHFTGQGVFRVGSFGNSTTNRFQSGASYFGIMELSGNVNEFMANLSDAEGRVFTGVNGNGKLSKQGNANQSNWPGTIAGEVTSSSNGSGVRGGSIGDGPQYLKVSDRFGRTYSPLMRAPHIGIRGVRAAP
jgi:formylglycine-generating enzyme required for sulfatase activity